MRRVRNENGTRHSTTVMRTQIKFYTSSMQNKPYSHAAKRKANARVTLPA